MTEKKKKIEAEKMSRLEDVEILGKIYADGGMTIGYSKDVFVIDFYDTPIYNKEKPQGVRVFLPVRITKEMVKKIEKAIKSQEQKFGESSESKIVSS